MNNIKHNPVILYNNRCCFARSKQLPRSWQSSIPTVTRCHQALKRHITQMIFSPQNADIVQIVSTCIKCFWQLLQINACANYFKRKGKIVFTQHYMAEFHTYIEHPIYCYQRQCVLLRTYINTQIYVPTTTMAMQINARSNYIRAKAKDYLYSIAWRSSTLRISHVLYCVQNQLVQLSSRLSLSRCICKYINIVIGGWLEHHLKQLSGCQITRGSHSKSIRPAHSQHIHLPQSFNFLAKPMTSLQRPHTENIHCMLRHSCRILL